MLEDFSDQGIACGIVTNGGTLMQRAKIEESGLQELVASFTISQDVGVAKPDPAIFAHALKTIGARAGTTLFVGDNPEHDVAGAKAVGMRTAWLGLGRQWPLANVTPDYTLDHVWQVRDLVLGDQR
jgi:putative hydrolase of the HAD superfamily